jgi:phage shock protein A
MLNFIKRLFMFGKAEANAAMDKFEDPIKMAEQGIRELQADLDKSIHSLAEVKALIIRTKKEQSELSNSANNYTEKAKQILLKGQNGEPLGPHHFPQSDLFSLASGDE